MLIVIRTIILYLDWKKKERENEKGCIVILKLAFRVLEKEKSAML